MCVYWWRATAMAVYVRGEKKKKKRKSIDVYKRPNMTMDDVCRWTPMAAVNTRSPAAAPMYYMYTAVLFFHSFSPHFLLLWKYLAQANSLSLFSLPKNMDQHLAKYIHTRRKKKKMFGRGPHIFPRLQLQSTDAFIHKLLPFSSVFWLSIDQRHLLSSFSLSL